MSSVGMLLFIFYLTTAFVDFYFFLVIVGKIKILLVKYVRPSLGEGTFTWYFSQLMGLLNYLL